MPRAASGDLGSQKRPGDPDSWLPKKACLRQPGAYENLAPHLLLTAPSCPSQSNALAASSHRTPAAPESTARLSRRRFRQIRLSR